MTSITLYSVVDMGGIDVRLISDLYHIFSVVDVGVVEVRRILTSTTFLVAW